MQPVIPTMTVNAKTAAAALGVSFETFGTWRKRNKLLQRCQNGRGFPAAFTFADVLAAYVAKKLMECGLAADSACAAADQAQTLALFLDGQRAEFYLRGREVVRQGAEPDEDLMIAVPLEGMGWTVAEAFAQVLPVEEGQNALTEFEALVSEHRSQI